MKFKYHDFFPTNTPRVFYVEPTLKLSIHVISTLNARGVFLGLISIVIGLADFNTAFCLLILSYFLNIFIGS